MEIRKKSAHPARSTIDGKSPAYKMVYHKAFILYKTPVQPFFFFISLAALAKLQKRKMDNRKNPLVLLARQLMENRLLTKWCTTRLLYYTKRCTNLFLYFPHLLPV